jgi:hypothetical protein
MFRSDLVRKRAPFYDERNLHADTGACYDVLTESDLGFVHQVLTYTRRHAAAFTSYTMRMRTYKPLHLEHLLKYGPACMSQEEFDREVGLRAAAYARLLIRCAPKFRDSEFREFHLAAISRLRSEMEFGRMATLAGRAAIRRLGRRPRLRRRRRRVTRRQSALSPD